MCSDSTGRSGASGGSRTHRFPAQGTIRIGAHCPLKSRRMVPLSLLRIVAPAYRARPRAVGVLPARGDYAFHCHRLYFSEQLVTRRSTAMARRPGTTVRHRPSARTPPPTPDRAVQAILAAVPLSGAQRTAIQQRYGARVTATLRSQPYRLLQDVAEMSFPTVDTLARKLGTSKSSPARLQTGMLAVLQQAIRQGHTGLPLPTLLRVRDLQAYQITIVG